MKRSNLKRDRIIITASIFILCHLPIIDTGASSTPKNLVNLYTRSPNDNLNSTLLNFFHNEPQQLQNDRQSISKYFNFERHKTSSSPTYDSIFENPSSDLNSVTSDDYLYTENRGTLKVPGSCKGRSRLSTTRGSITDGPHLYDLNLQCIWIINNGQPNATIRIQIHRFNTECNYDYLYIFDGDSIFSPLIASLSGDLSDFSHGYPTIFNDRKLTNHLNSSVKNQHDMSHSYQATNEAPPFELITKSGKAFLYFHSDTAQRLQGFYITYSIDSCPLDCSNRGECNLSSLECKCNTGYFGKGCQYSLCPQNCTSPFNGICDAKLSCVCNEGFGGLDCSIRVEEQAWVPREHNIHSIPPRAFHQAITVGQIMWIIGGRTEGFSNPNVWLHQRSKSPIVYKFDLETLKWSDDILYGETGIDHLAELSGHSAAAKGSKIFIYGGLAMNNSVLNALTVLDTKTNSLTNLMNGRKYSIDDEFSAPIAVVGHSANIVDGHMYIFFGYNPIYGYLDLVQKFNLASNSWSIIERKGSSVIGHIGHTSTYDPNSRLIFVFGGHNAHRSSSLYSFDPYTEVWTFLQSGPYSRYYHSSIIIDNQLIILGGNGNVTSLNSDQCYQPSYLTYDLTCSKVIMDSARPDNLTNNNCGGKCWKSIPEPRAFIIKRHGHSLVKHGRELILFGGFNGMLTNSLHTMSLGSCSTYDGQNCARPKLALKCVWNSNDSRCEDQSLEPFNITSALMSEIDNTECSKSDIKASEQFCESRETCSECLNTNAGCTWCSYFSGCQYAKCKTPTKGVVDPELCYKSEIRTAKSPNSGINSHSTLNQDDLDNEIECTRQENCFLCYSKPHCSMHNELCMYNSLSMVSSPSTSHQPEEVSSSYVQNNFDHRSTNLSRLDLVKRPFFQSAVNTCDSPCYMRHSCRECTTTKCIWCGTSNQCIDSSSYFAYHTMGQCMHYVAHIDKCSISSCSDIITCNECLTNPKCGWLSDVSGNGKGRCIQGTSRGPSLEDDHLPSESASNATDIGVLSNWYYSTCPLCQCNGHSYCNFNSSSCFQPCLDHTEGSHCDRCVSGFFGDPINGGICRPCRCNGHAHTCNRHTGKCHCTTKGITGHNCNRCDDQNNYIGYPAASENGTCYYNLTTDYQYTFNMSKSDDTFYSDINLINVPLRKDSDIDFTIACSRTALVNITSGTSYQTRRLVQAGLECGSFRLRFPHNRILNEPNYSFFVHVYKFHTPFVLQIAFSQHRTLYLPQFFFTFSSFFLFFFALFGLIWKLKHEYDLYVRRQRQFIRMEQLASRPFSSILLSISKPETAKQSNQPSQPISEPSPISFEPCSGSGNNIGVLSFFVQFPGKPGLAVGSALVKLNDETLDETNSSKQLESQLSGSSRT